MSPTALHLLLFGAGLVSGVVNVVGGGGSFLTLPILLFAGLPAAEANATNRLSILFQSVSAVWGFKRHGVIEWGLAFRYGLIACLGAIVGAFAVFSVGDVAFKRILATFMVLLAGWSILGKRPTALPGKELPAWAAGAAFFVIGIYGGFIQAGVGFLILAATSRMGLDLVRGNALKVLAVLFFSVVALAIFFWKGAVNWPLGLSLAAGSTLGGLIGARVTVGMGEKKLKLAVTALIVIFAVKLWLE